VRLAELVPAPSRTLRRGALTDAFAHLFELPFDQAAVERLDRDVDLRATAGAPVPDWWTSHSAKVTGAATLAAGGAAFVLAGAFVVSAFGDQRAADRSDGAARVTYNQEIEARNHWATALAIGGGVLAAAGLAVLLWRRHATESAGGLW
jgi:hypothetical protein